MNHESDKKFLEWLKNRLINKYHEDNSIVNTLDSIIKTKVILSAENKIINQAIVEKICNKVWPNFDGSNSGDIIGITEYSESERNEIRKCVTGILLEFRNAKP
jgi:hypothetical protein